MKFALLMLMSLSVEGIKINHAKLESKNQVRAHSGQEPNAGTVAASSNVTGNNTYCPDCYPPEVPVCKEGYKVNPQYNDCENINDPSDYYTPQDEYYGQEEPCTVADGNCGPPSQETEYDMAQDIMDQFDSNGDNAITWDEVKQHTKAMGKEMVEYQLQDLKPMFIAADIDGDGSVTMPELRNAVDNQYDQ